MVCEWCANLGEKSVFLCAEVLLVKRQSDRISEGLKRSRRKCADFRGKF